MDIAVVDDEKAIREHICGLVEERQPESRIEAYATGEELLASGKRFDIVFLDIQMEGMNGIEAARSLREKQGDTVLVFITGIKDYVFDAFDLYAFQYLLKPIDERKYPDLIPAGLKTDGPVQCVMWQRGILGRKHKSERGCIPCDSHVTAGGEWKK